MGDWIGLGIFVLVVAGAVAGLSYLGRPAKPMTNEEFERRAAESRGTMSAGVAGVMHALQKLMNPKAAEAVEVQKDLRAGYYDDEEHGGEGGGEEPADKSLPAETRGRGEEDKNESTL